MKKIFLIHRRYLQSISRLAPKGKRIITQSRRQLKMEFIVIYCTVPSKKEGKEIAKNLVQHHLVACVNIIDKIESVFSWDGELCEEKEALMIIKTKKELFNRVNILIQKLHSYTVPEVIAIPVIEADETYLKWIAHETKEG